MAGLLALHPAEAFPPRQAWAVAEIFSRVDRTNPTNKMDHSCGDSSGIKPVFPFNPVRL